MTRERCALALLWAVSALVVGALMWILGDVLMRGVGALSGEFLLSAPRDAGRAGGIGSLIVSTLWIVLIAVAVALPLGFLAAVRLADHRHGRTARLVRASLDVLNAVPSIVFGLFGSGFFCVTLGLGYSILAGGLTLAIMVLPILIRTTESALRAVPRELTLAGTALGLSRTTTLMRVVAPAALPAVGLGLLLGIGRALSETAALIFTSGYVTRFPESMFDSGRALSVHIFDLAMNVPGGNERAYSTALVLIGLLLVINVAVRLVAARFSARMAP